MSICTRCRNEEYLHVDNDTLRVQPTLEDGEKCDKCGKGPVPDGWSP